MSCRDGTGFILVEDMSDSVYCNRTVTSCICICIVAYVLSVNEKVSSLILKMSGAIVEWTAPPSLKQTAKF